MNYENTHTTINITKENWRALHLLKGCGESFNDVVTRLLKEGAKDERAD